MTIDGSTKLTVNPEQDRRVDGVKIAAEIIKRLQQQPRLKKFLAAVLVDDDPASVSFLKQKEKVAKELGLDFRLYKFPTEIKNDALREEVLKISQHKTCGGIIVQLPLPEHINRHYILNVIPREKDVDVLGERALGAFLTGRNPVLPPSVGTVQAILQITHYSLPTLNVAVVGLGFLIGKPVSVWLMGKVRELILLHRGSDFSMLKNADLVILGVGRAGLVKLEMLKSGAGVIDFGYDNGRGNLDIERPTSNLSHLTFYTPTPGGTGPILVAKLYENFYTLNVLR